MKIVSMRITYQFEDKYEMKDRMSDLAEVGHSLMNCDHKKRTAVYEMIKMPVAFNSIELDERCNVHTFVGKYDCEICNHEKPDSKISYAVAESLLEDVLDTLIEVGNGTTDKDLAEAREKVFTFRDRFFKQLDGVIK